MKTQVSALIVTIEQDPIPGWGNDALDHEKWLRGTLTGLIPHYHPKVALVRSAPISDEIEDDIDVLVRSCK